MDRISKILRTYLSARIPQKVTNILFQMFNGIEAAFVSLEIKLSTWKRERNILTAQNISSLRNLAAMNGFEPVLKIPASGVILLKVQNSLFGRAGYPLFVPPYATFTDKLTKIKYYYNSNIPYKLSQEPAFLPIVEGTIKTVQIKSSGNFLERIYLKDSNIANGSISIMINDLQFAEVKSLYDNDGTNENNIFVVKYSSDINNPIVLYVKNTKLSDILNISYKLTFGEVGNIQNNVYFETNDIIDSQGNEVEVDDSEITITNHNGFDFGSNGTDENSLRAAIGYNHGINILFDNISYSTFLGRYSNLLIQKIVNPKDTKAINWIYVSKKQSVSLQGSIQNLIWEYEQIILTEGYKFSAEEKKNLSKHVEEFEYCLSSHILKDSETNKYAFQISLKTIDDINKYGDKIKFGLYSEFAKFFYLKNHAINVELLMQNFMKEFGITFDYYIFNEEIEQDKISGLNPKTNHIISHLNKLPLLKGDFKIIDSEKRIVDLFFDVNIVKSLQ